MKALTGNPAPLLHPSFAPGWSRNLPTALDALIARLRATSQTPVKP